MNQPAIRTGAFEGDAPQIMRLGPDRASVSGTVAQVNGVVERLRARGQLATITDPQPNGAGGVLVTVRVLPREVALPLPEPQRWTRNWVLGVAGGVATMLTLCGLAVRAMFLWLAAHAADIGTALLVLAGVAVAVVVARLFGGGTFEGTFRGRWR